MTSSIFDDLNIDEVDFKLPGGETIKIVALDIFQRLDIQKKINALQSEDETTKSALFKEVAQMAVLDDDYEPYLSKRDLNKLARVGNGQVLFEIFGEVMALSGANTESAEEAKKK